MCCLRKVICLLLILSGIAASRRNGRGRRLRQRLGDPDELDFDLPDERTRQEMRRFRRIGKMRTYLREKCRQTRPADIFLRSKEGLSQTFLVTMCDADADNSFKDLWKDYITNEDMLRRRGTKVYKVHADRSIIRQMARHGKVASIEQEELLNIAQRCKLQSVNTTLYNLDKFGKKNNKTVNGKFKYNTTFQENVNIYIVDSGVQKQNDIEGRMHSGFCCYDSGCFPSDLFCDARIDENGHGSHVAGTAAGTTHGVAKGCKIVSIRVMDYLGDNTQTRYSLMTIVHALRLIADVAKPKLSVVNISLGGKGSSMILSIALDDLYTQNITVAVAAGNAGDDSCDYMPANEESVLTVGSTDENDTFCSFSNHGACVDILAPGNAITSLGMTEGVPAIMTGTSMASPLIAGGAAVLLAQYFEDGGLTPQEVRQKLLALASVNATGVPSDTTPRIGSTKCYRKD